MKYIKKISKFSGTIKIFPFFRINLWFFPMIFFSFLSDYSTQFLSAYCMAAIHETAHIICAVASGIRISYVTFFPFGLAANLNSGYIKRSDKEFIIAFVGPLSNILLFWLFTFLFTLYHNELFRFCADINLALCTINLIPALPLDGGRMLKAFLVARYGTIRAYNVMIKISKFFIIILFLIALSVFVCTNFNFSLILISAFLFQNLSREQASISRITMTEIYENSQKLKEHAMFPSKTFLAKETSLASSVFRILSYDYYTVIHIVNEDSHIVKTVSETDILKSLTQKGIRLKFKDI